MSALVESMFYVRNKPWHGLGTMVEEAVSSSEALEKAGLDWKVIQRDVYSQEYSRIPGYKVNIRSSDGSPLGIVSDRLRISPQRHVISVSSGMIVPK